MALPKLNKYSDLEQKYTELGEFPNRVMPICIIYDTPGRYFGFIGVTHTNNPEHPMWGKYIEEWKKFISSNNKNKLVLVEGNGRKANGETLEEAIIDGGDTGATAWLADKNNIDYFSPEPSYSKQITLLKDKFTDDEIITYYIGRQLHHYVRSGYKKYKDIEDCVSRTLNLYKDFYPKWDEDYSVETTIKLIEKYINKKILVAKAEDFMKIDNPSQNPVSQLCNEIRDIEIYLALEKAWNQNKDVFCAYGSGHALILEDAIKELFNH